MVGDLKDAEGGKTGRYWGLDMDVVGMALVLLGLTVIFGVMSQNFWSAGTFRSLANQAPDLVVVSVGMTLVLVVGGIDLSVGSVLALSGAVLGIVLMRWELPLWAALGACLATGAVCGALNGLISAIWSVPAFIVTLGMMEIARGLAYGVTNARTAYLERFLDPVVKPIPGLGLAPTVLAAIVVVVGAHLALTRTVWGRHAAAVGGNDRAALYSGIDPGRCRFVVFVLSGVLASLAAIFQCARLSAADPNAGNGLELSAIAAVVIGGTRLRGGRGNVLKTLLGVLIISVLQSGLAQLSAGESTKRLVTGTVIIVAVLLDEHRGRFARAIRFMHV